MAPLTVPRHRSRMPTDQITAAQPLKALANFRIAIPERLRALVRGREVWLVVLAAAVGVIAGLAVVAMNAIVDTMHQLLFHLDVGSRLRVRFEIQGWAFLRMRMPPMATRIMA